MKQIRSQVFETNSSSTHSISVAEEGEGVLGTLPIDKKGVVTIGGGEYGWEQESYNDPYTKADYLAIYARECYPEEGIAGVSLWDILCDVIKDQTGCKEAKYVKGGFIDHQSVGSNDYHWVFESPEKLRLFIFSHASYLETDNDNH
jgi:hypothetical protein